MKNLSLILNAVLIVAVGVLFYLHFSAKGSTTAGPAKAEGISIYQPDVPIVYVNIDTLLSNYEYFNDMQNDFADKQSELEAELNNRSRCCVINNTHFNVGVYRFHFLERNE